MKWLLDRAVYLGRVWREGTIRKHRARRARTELKIRKKRRALAAYNRRHGQDLPGFEDVRGLFKEPPKP